MTSYRIAYAFAIVCGLAGNAWASGPYTTVSLQGGFPSSLEGSAFAIDGNIAVFDYDLDGDLDVVFTGDGSPFVRLYRNDDVDGKSVFVEQVDVGLDSLQASTNTVSAGDMNGDGYPDLFVGNEGQLYFFRNQTDGSFTNETALRLPGRNGFVSAVSVADFDRDGDLDAYVARYATTVSWPFHKCGLDTLLVNNGKGFFEEAPESWGIESRGCGLSSVWTDVDEDGDLDLLVANDFGFFVEPSHVYENVGQAPGESWAFLESSEKWNMGRVLYGMGIGVFDSNRDGHMDYYFTSIGRDVLLRGSGGGPATDVTEEAGLGSTWSETGYRTKWSPIRIDIDGDGWEDLYVRSGHVPAYWFISNPKDQTDLSYVFDAEGVATSAEESFPIAWEQGRGGVAADLDGDGIRDLLLVGTDGETLRYWKGTGSEKGVWLYLESTVSAAGAPGARSLLMCEGYTKVDELTPGGWFGSGAPMGRLFVGVPDDCGPGWTLELRWPSGARSTLQEPLEETVTLLEPDWWMWESESWEEASVFRINPTLGNVDGIDGMLPLVGVTEEGGESVLVEVEEGWFEWTDPGNLAPGASLQILQGDGVVASTHLPLGILSPRVYPAAVVGGKVSRVFFFDDPKDPGENISIVVEAGGVLEYLTSIGQHIRAAEVSVELGAPELRVKWSSDESEMLFVAPITPPVIPELSSVVVENLFFSLMDPSGKKPLRITVSGKDLNAWPDVPASITYVVFVDGEVTVTGTANGYGTPTVMQVYPDDFGPGSEIEVFFNGTLMAPKATVFGYENEEELLAFIDPVQSQFSVAHEACRADGMDRVAVVFKPKSAEGNPLPTSALSGLLSVGGEGISTVSTLASVGKFMEGELRCGEEVGEGSVLLLEPDGSDTGIETHLVRRAPEPLAAADPETSSLGLLGLGEGFWMFNFRPRSSDNNLLGSGYEVLALFNDGEGCVQMEYCGIGKYCMTEGIPIGTYEVQIVVDGVWVGAPSSLEEEEGGVNVWPEPSSSCEPWMESGEESGGDAMDGDAMDEDAMDGDAMDGDAMDEDAMDEDAMDEDAMDEDAMDEDAEERGDAGRAEDSTEDGSQEEDTLEDGNASGGDGSRWEEGDGSDDVTSGDTLLDTGGDLDGFPNADGEPLVEVVDDSENENEDSHSSRNEKDGTVVGLLGDGAGNTIAIEQESGAGEGMDSLALSQGESGGCVASLGTQSETMGLPFFVWMIGLGMWIRGSRLHRLFQERSPQ